MVDDPLLRAIIQDPDDDAPRLVYADWLDEHGESARAAFIRAQVKLARMPEDDPERVALVQIERTLWRAHRDEWLEWVPTWATVREFHRGFLESVRCDAAAFMAGADELRQFTPLMTVRLDGLRDLAVPIFRSRVLEGLRGLAISMHVRPDDWQHLADSPYLGRLEKLNLSSCQFAASIVRAMPDSAAFPSLRHLRLRYCDLSGEHTSPFVGHPWIARLQTLDLSQNFIHADGGQAIADSPHLDGIMNLDLLDNPLAASLAVASALRQRFGSRVCM